MLGLADGLVLTDGEGDGSVVGLGVGHPTGGGSAWHRSAAAASVATIRSASAGLSAGILASNLARSKSGNWLTSTGVTCSTVANPEGPGPWGMPWNTATEPSYGPT